MKKLLFAAIVVLMASPAFAAIQDVKVSGDITSTFLDRNEFDLGGQVTGTPVGLTKQNVFITQTRLRVDADLSDNVSTTVGLINERAWNSEPGLGTSKTGDTSVELYLASVTMRELLYSPLTVTVGRQVFNYGNGLIIGDGGPNNGATGGALAFVAGDLTMRTAYDGIKAVLDYKPLTIDMFYFKNNETEAGAKGILGTTGVSSNANASSDVYGLNANYQLGDAHNTVVEGYLFSRLSGSGDNLDGLTPGTGKDKGDTLYVPGLRASTNPVKGLNVQGELAWQLGDKPVQASSGQITGERREAMAVQLMASYALPVLEKYKPSVNASWTYVSGDKNGNINTSGTNGANIKSAKVYSAWDPFNEAQGSGTIYNTLFNLSNMNIIALGASVNPLQDVTVAATWSGLWSAAPYTNGATSANPLNLVQPDSTTTIGPVSTKHDETTLGNEWDVNVNYAYTEDVNFGLSLGWFVPGDVFSYTNNKTASQALANVAVKF